MKLRYKVMYLLTILVLLGTIVISCTEQSRARSFGGSSTVNLPKGIKLINVTWKENSLWYLGRKMRDDEKPETYQLQEDSSLGLIQGTVTLNESK